MVDKHVRKLIAKDVAARGLTKIREQKPRKLARNGLPKWVVNFKAEDAIALSSSEKMKRR